MPYPSIFCMLFPQQTSTTQVRTAREINTKMEGFFMREIKNTRIIAVDHGYGNIKTANTVTPTGITASLKKKLHVFKQTFLFPGHKETTHSLIGHNQSFAVRR